MQTWWMSSFPILLIFLILFLNRKESTKYLETRIKRRTGDNEMQELAKRFLGKDVIASMMTPKVDGERVKSSNLSDKTAQIALEYREKQARMNREWYAYLEKQLQCVNDEIVFLEAAIDSLPDKLAFFMRDLVIEHLTWDALENKYHISRFTVSAYRKKAIRELEARYDEREKEMIAYMLG